MDSESRNVLLADDDFDDCLFFRKALNEVSSSFILTTVRDGEELMQYLEKNTDKLPDFIFLDLAMPRKTGYQCLSEIKENEKLKNIPITIFSTSYTSGIDFEQKLIKSILNLGADNYIRKPESFEKLKKVIQDIVIKEPNKKGLII